MVSQHVGLSLALIHIDVENLPFSWLTSPVWCLQLNRVRCCADELGCECHAIPAKAQMYLLELWELWKEWASECLRAKTAFGYTYVRDEWQKQYGINQHIL